MKHASTATGNSMRTEVKKLYRKVNTRARGVRHDTGGDFRHQRNAKKPVATKMAQGKQRGLDYTPLFKFLLSKTGQTWQEVYREAVARLDKPDPIFLLVAAHRDDAEDYVRVGESSYFSGMYVDDDGILRITAPEVTADDLEPSCKCCTHTLNGMVFTKAFGE